MAESFCCSPETTTALLISYIPVQNKKFKVKKIKIKKQKVNIVVNDCLLFSVNCITMKNNILNIHKMNKEKIPTLQIGGSQRKCQNKREMCMDLEIVMRSEVS